MNTITNPSIPMKNIAEFPVENDHSIFGQLQLKSPESIALHMDIAGIGARSHAFIIDWHIRLLLALAWIFAIGYSIFSLSGLTDFIWKDASDTELFIWLMPAGVIYFFYHPILEIAMSGRTPGKRMAGVRLVKLNGLTPGTGALLVRNIFRLLDSLPAFYILGLGTVALTRHQVRIGDMAAGLILVYDSEVSQKELKQISDLAMNSSLTQKDQALLLDLLKRWPNLQLEVRLKLGEKFLNKVGHKTTLNRKQNNKTRSNEIMAQLVQLTQLPENRTND